jgi:hypothetical protein
MKKIVTDKYSLIMYVSLNKPRSCNTGSSESYKW